MLALETEVGNYLYPPSLMHVKLLVSTDCGMCMWTLTRQMRAFWLGQETPSTVGYFLKRKETGMAKENPVLNT